MSDCSARAVYVPGLSPANVADHVACAVTWMLCTGVCPLTMPEPEKSCTVTPGRSPGAVPADPLTSCDALPVELPFGGEVSVGCGATVSIVKVTGAEVPFRDELTCLAIAVYCPSGRAGAAGPELQPPPLACCRGRGDQRSFCAGSSVDLDRDLGRVGGRAGEGRFRVIGRRCRLGQRHRRRIGIDRESHRRALADRVAKRACLAGLRGVRAFLGRQRRLALLEAQVPPLVPRRRGRRRRLPCFDRALHRPCTVTGVVSVAVPLNDGFVLFECDIGWSSVTDGAVVSTVNVTRVLSPVGLPSELCWVATAL